MMGFKAKAKPPVMRLSPGWIVYDDACRLCKAFKQWLEREKTRLAWVFLPRSQPQHWPGALQDYASRGANSIEVILANTAGRPNQRLQGAEAMVYLLGWYWLK